MTYTSIMGAKQSIQLDTKSTVLRTSDLVDDAGNKVEASKDDEVKDDIPTASCDSSGNNIVIVQEQRTVSVPIVDSVGCGCIDVYACSEGRLQGVKMDMKPESTIVKCHCTCVPPCECESTKTDSIPVKSSWSVPHIFTKTTDIEKRLDDIEVQFHKLKESLNNNVKRIETLETNQKMDVTQ